VAVPPYAVTRLTGSRDDDGSARAAASRSRTSSTSVVVAWILHAHEVRLAIDIAVFHRFDEKRRRGWHRARHRRVGESHLRSRRLSAVKVVVPGLFVPGIRIALLRRRRLQSQRRVELHDGVDVVNHRAVRASPDDERTVFARRRRLRRGRNGYDEVRQRRTE
jgi:hypothetical protein